MVFQNSRHCFIMLWNMKICSTHECLCWKLVCSSLNLESTAVEILLRITTQKTLLGTDKSVNSPPISTFSPDFLSWEFWWWQPFCHSLWNNLYLPAFIHDICLTLLPECLLYISAALLWSGQGQCSFVVFQIFILHPISLLLLYYPDIGSVLQRESFNAKIAWVTVGSGWFRVSLNVFIPSAGLVHLY